MGYQIISAEISGPPFECMQIVLIINFARGIKYFRGVQIFQEKVDQVSTFLGAQIYHYRPQRTYCSCSSRYVSGLK